MFRQNSKVFLIVFLLHSFVDVRLKKFLEEKNDLLDQIRRLTIELEEERNKHSKGDRGGAQHNTSNSSAYTNGPGEDSIDAHSECSYSHVFNYAFVLSLWKAIYVNNFVLEDASKQLADYRFKTQKYEQEIATLQANVSFLVQQFLYKSVFVLMLTFYNLSKICRCPG